MCFRQRFRSPMAPKIELLFKVLFKTYHLMNDSSIYFYIGLTVAVGMVTETGHYKWGLK